MEGLKRSRQGHKAHITVLRNKLTDVLNRRELAEMETLRESLNRAMDKIDSIDEQIFSSIKEEESLAQEITVAGEYSYEVRLDINRVNQAMAEIMPTPPNDPQAPHTTRGVKLPKLNISKFSGDFTQWKAFWDIFNTSVHKRTDLEQIEKFTYLKGLLEGDALRLVEGFSLEAHYYDEAVGLLQTTYGRDTEIKMCFVKKLLELDSPEVSAESLQQFRSNFECQIRSLNTLGLKLEELYTILLYNKLPASMAEIIKRKAEDDWLNLDTFKKQLEAEINNLRIFQDKDDFVTSNAVSTVSTMVVQSNKPRNNDKGCSLCKAAHIWFRCPKYESRDAKLHKLKELGLCFVCAQKGHLSSQCKARNCGKGCTYDHNICICPKTKGDVKPKGNISKGKFERSTKPENVKVTTLKVGSV